MKKTVKDIEIKGKKALVRCDFNVPLKEGKITDDIRIVSALPTIKYLIEGGAKVILMSHLGRPEGEPNPKYTLAPVAERLSELLGQEIVFISADTVVDEKVKEAAAALEEGQVMLLENVRFRKGETKNCAEFAKELAALNFFPFGIPPPISSITSRSFATSSSVRSLQRISGSTPASARIRFELVRPIP